MSGESVPANSRRSPASLALACASVVAVLLTVAVLDRGRFPSYYKATVYPLYAGAFAWALWTLVADVFAWVRAMPEQRSPESSARAGWPYDWATALVCGLLGFHIALTVPMEYRILNDEGYSLSTAKSLHFDRLPVAIHESRFVDGGYTNEHPVLDKRPIGYPFFVSIAHDLTGHRPRNGFALNLLLAVLSGLAFYRVCRIFHEPAVAIAGPVLLMSYPLFKLSATSGGLEMANLLFILLSVVAFAGFLEAPSSRKLTRALLVFVLLAQIRYESALYLLVAAPFYLAYGGRRLLECLSPWHALIPFFMLPVLWQRLPQLSRGHLQVPESEAVFGIDHLISNGASNIRFLADWDGIHPVTGPVFYLAVAGALLWLWKRRTQGESASRIPASTFRLIAAYALVQALFLGAYYWGDFTVLGAERLALALIPWLVLPALYLLAAVLRAASRLRAGTLIPVLIALVVYLSQHPRTAGAAHLALVVPRTVNESVAWLSSQPGFDESLVIADYPESFSVFGRSVLGLQEFRVAPDRVAGWLRAGTFREVYVIQTLLMPSRRPDQNQGIPAMVEYDVVHKRRLGPLRLMRILALRLPAS